jgi:hypothetical protein
MGMVEWRSLGALILVERSFLYSFLLSFCFVLLCFTLLVLLWVLWILWILWSFMGISISFSIAFIGSALLFFGSFGLLLASASSSLVLLWVLWILWSFIGISVNFIGLHYFSGRRTCSAWYSCHRDDGDTRHI